MNFPGMGGGMPPGMGGAAAGGIGSQSGLNEQEAAMVKYVRLYLYSANYTWSGCDMIWVANAFVLAALDPSSHGVVSREIRHGRRHGFRARRRVRAVHEQCTSLHPSVSPFAR